MSFIGKSVVAFVVGVPLLNIYTNSVRQMDRENKIEEHRASLITMDYPQDQFKRLEVPGDNGFCILSPNAGQKTLANYERADDSVRVVRIVNKILAETKNNLAKSIKK